MFYDDHYSKWFCCCNVANSQNRHRNTERWHIVLAAGVHGWLNGELLNPPPQIANKRVTGGLTGVGHLLFTPLPLAEFR